MAEPERPVLTPDTSVDNGGSWWLLPNLHDGLGDRLLSFGDDGAMVEMLRLDAALTAQPAFADAVRAQLDRLAGLRSPWVSRMQLSETAPGILELTSEHCAMRFGDVETRDPATILALLEQLLFAASVLHGHDRSVAHGCITTSRVALTADGHVRLLEPAFGAAIAALPPQERRERNLTPPGAPEGVDRAHDVAQCALLAAALIDGSAPASASAAAAAVRARCAAEIAAWFSRALRVDSDGWTDAHEALAALQRLLAETPQHRASLVAALQPGAHAGAAQAGVPVEMVGLPLRAAEPADIRTAEAPAPVKADTKPAARPVRERPAAVVEPARPRKSRTPLVLGVVALLLAVVVAAQTVYILRTSGPTTISVNAPAPPAVIEAPPAPAVTATAPAVSLASADAARPVPPRPADTRPPAPAGPVAGWLAVRSPIEVDILRDGELIGTSRSTRLMLPEGRHALELVNARLGFRQPINVTIAPGAESTLPVTVPDGVVHMNAVPWAEVFVDGRRIGETPLGNVRVPIGSHEVLFRHPQLGERRQAIVVTAGTPSRVSVDLRQ
jgi:hypothetical protein